MSAEPRQQDRSKSVATGALKDVQMRSVQAMGGSDNCCGVNLSRVGSVILGVAPGDDVSLVIYENGVWIPKNE